MTALLAAALAAPYHAIEVVDQAGRPVACAAIETTGHARWSTDRLGRAAFFEPGLMDRPVWLVVSGEGLAAPTDWLG
ncbi:MAG TPA: hypothetical protein PKA64_19275, partial [Myxococcota bacterium]|nr:hypothetical protein [Myxococcota bacterium]